jgi:hypothetical protein
VKILVLDLTQALQIEPAARTLPSRIADRTVSGDLAILYGRVDSNQLDIAVLQRDSHISCDDILAVAIVLDGAVQIRGQGFASGVLRNEFSVSGAVA